MNQEITQAFIFAAGRGERMRPLTDQTPKPLLKIHGKTIIDYTIEKLLAIPSIQRIVVNGFYLADQLQDHLASFNDSRLIFSRETAKIETGGGLVFARDNGLIDENQPLLCMNGDVVWLEKEGESDIKQICDQFLLLNSGLSHNNPLEINTKILPKILLGLKPCKEYFGYEINENKGGDFNLIDGMLYKKEGIMSHAFVGLQIIDLSILKQAPKPEFSGTDSCFSINYFYRKALDEKSGLLQEISGCELAGKYFHLGDPQSLAAAQDLFENLKEGKLVK